MRNPSTRPDGHLQQRVQKASGPYGGALLPGLRLLRPEASRLVVGTRPSWVDHCYFLERTVTFKLPSHRPEFCTCVSAHWCGVRRKAKGTHTVLLLFALFLQREDRIVTFLRNVGAFHPRGGVCAEAEHCVSVSSLCQRALGSGMDVGQPERA